jgi:hypothetical protein
MIMASTPDEDLRYLSVRNPARLAVVLNGFGGAAILLAILFFGGSFYVENEIGRAFCLGAFFSGLLGGIVLFGFAKIIDMLDAIRRQTIETREEAAGSDAAPGPGPAGGSGSGPDPHLGDGPGDGPGDGDGGPGESPS